MNQYYVNILKNCASVENNYQTIQKRGLGILTEKGVYLEVET